MIVMTFEELDDKSSMVSSVDAKGLKRCQQDQDGVIALTGFTLKIWLFEDIYLISRVF
ncbi:MAG: hypothetical protein ISS63_03520 [Desulfobacteraceae bacterium]|nr:hypothetical protein [Desulfobacteraceae bacterium]